MNRRPAKLYSTQVYASSNSRSSSQKQRERQTTEMAYADTEKTDDKSNFCKNGRQPRPARAGHVSGKHRSMSEQENIRVGEHQCDITKNHTCT
ncbi:hypothetical protein J6590_019201 [Homalodisca vitripennis]|nr:hypothetical protein J6590_019201 [Homalodisca vitripennis]